MNYNHDWIYKKGSSNSVNILVVQTHINLKFLPSIKLWWHLLLTKFQVKAKVFILFITILLL